MAYYKAILIIKTMEICGMQPIWTRLCIFALKNMTYSSIQKNYLI